MTAARTKQHQREKHTGVSTDKNRKRRKPWATKQESRTLGVENNKASCLLQSRAGALATRFSILFLPSSTAVPSVTINSAAVEPPLREQINQRKTNKTGLEGAVRSNSDPTCWSNRHLATRCNFLTAPLGSTAVAFCGLDLPTSSTITSMHEAAAGRQPTAAKPPCIRYLVV